MQDRLVHPPQDPAPAPATSESLSGARRDDDGRAPARVTLTVMTGERAGEVATTDGAAMTIGRAKDADLAIDDADLSLHHARIARAAEGTFYAEDLRSAHGTFLNGEPIGVALLHAGDVLRLGPHIELRLAITVSRDELVHANEDPATRNALTRDGLTRAYSRRYMTDRLAAEVAAARRAAGDVTVLMIDIDDLKVVNARFGRVAGDRALREVADRIGGVLRAEDAVARHGGDKFVVVASRVPEEPRRLAERVRRAIKGLRMKARGREVRLTVSAGAASLSELVARDDDASSLLSLAESRMHEARGQGGDRVCATGGAS